MSKARRSSRLRVLPHDVERPTADPKWWDETDHAQDTQMGGEEGHPDWMLDRLRRAVAVLRQYRTWTPLPGVPRGGRKECRTGPRPCPYVQCRYNLWILLQEERAGNPALGSQGETTVLPQHEASCALDIAERGGVSPREIGSMLGMDRTRVWGIVDKAIKKLRALGVRIEDLR